MRVLAACSLGGSGHLQPLLPLLEAAGREGHEILIAGPPALSDMVAATGFSFAAGGEPPESVIAPIRQRLPIVPSREAAILANREIFGALATDAMLPSMRELFGTWQPNLIVRDPCEYSSAITAIESKTPVAQVAIGLAAVEWDSISIAGPALEGRREGLVEVLRMSPYLSRFPGSLDPSPFTDTRRYDDSIPPTKVRLPSDWWTGSDLPLVYVTFGTVLGHMKIAAAVYRAALEAVRGLDLRVLLTVGRTFDPGLLGATPTNVHVESWVDQNVIFRDASAVVCHGGSGTTFGALRAGLPLVLIPLFADQRANGTKVAECQAGVVVHPSREAEAGRSPFDRGDAPAVADAIRAVLGDSSYSEHAARVSQEMAAAPSPTEVLGELLRNEKAL